MNHLALPNAPRYTMRPLWLSLCVVLFSPSSYAADRLSVELAPVQIQGEYVTPSTTIDEYTLQVKDGGDPQRALRATPGVFTTQASNQPGIEINIRGLSGNGRINTMIDGVPQNFKNVAGHSASGGQLIYVHPELLAGMNITRGIVSGAHGNGVLGGAANLHTLSEQDVLQHGNTGGLTRIRLGNNGAHSSGMAAVGHRFIGVGDADGTLSIIAAAAYKSEGNYKTGKDEKLSKAYSSINSPKGGLAKVRFKPNPQHQLDIGTVWYNNTFNNSSYEWEVHNRTFTTDYTYTPGSQWVDLHSSFYTNKTTLDYTAGTGGYVGRRIDNNTWGINVSNASTLSVQHANDLRLSYGLAWDHNEYAPKRMQGGNHPGEIAKGSAFSNAEWVIGQATVLAGLRYDYYRLKGYRPPYGAGVADCPAGGPICGDNWESHSSGELLPNIGLQYELTPQWSVYGMYAHTFRPPSTHEAFYAMVPFGDGKGSGHANNLALKPERSQGWDFALSFRDQNLLTEGDQARLRIGYFNNRIKNYTVNDFNRVPGIPYEVIMWVNSPNPVRLRGWEIEGGYDLGFLYANLSYSHSTLDEQPLGFGTGMNGGTASLAPDTYWTLDVGTRLFDERVNLGAQFRRFGASKAAFNDWFNDPTWKKLPGYTLVDLYGNYTLNKHINVFVNVENLSNRAYGFAGSLLSNYNAQTGRGRTIMAGIQASF